MKPSNWKDYLIWKKNKMKLYFTLKYHVRLEIQWNEEKNGEWEREGDIEAKKVEKREGGKDGWRTN